MQIVARSTTEPPSIERPEASTIDRPKGHTCGGRARKSLDAALATSTLVPAFIERVYPVFALRSRTPGFYHLLREAARHDGIVNRRGNLPSVKTFSREWPRFEEELERRRARQLEAAAEQSAWQAAITVAPSVVPGVERGRPQGIARHPAGGRPATQGADLAADTFPAEAEITSDDELIHRLILKQTGLEPDD